LFDLDADPLEEHDLAGSRTHAGVEQSLTDQTLRGWDPDRIAALQEQRKAEHALLADWARSVRPADQYRWQIKPEDNWLRERGSGMAMAV
jgi:hypothetical protein